MKKACAIGLFLITQSILAKSIPFTIYHTNDLHSHFDGVKIKTATAGEYKVRGSFDRLSTAINKIRNEKKEAHEIVIGVDAGDFFAGTIFSAIAPSKSADFPEFEFLSNNQFDIVTLGNHEFDATNTGLERLFSKALKLNSNTTFVATNLTIKDAQSTLNKYIGNDSLIKNVVIKDFTNGTDKIRVGFLGLLGPDACLVSKSTRGDVGFIGFNDEKSKADVKELVKFFNQKISDLKIKNQVDVIVISMHGGGKEAASIVKDLTGVDVVIAGHTHEVERKVIDGKILSQTGDYGQNLGVLELKYDTDTKKVSLVDSNKSSLVPIDDSIKPNLEWTKRITNWRNQSFKIMGHGDTNANEIVFTSDRDYIRESVIQNELGRMLSTRLLDELNTEGVNADFYFTSMGLVRESIQKGIPYNKADIFELVGIGYDNNLVPGIDTVSFYLTVKEVKSLVSFMELYSHVSKNFAPVFSNNLTFEVSKYGVPFVNRIKGLKLNGQDIDGENRLIKVATNRFVINNLGTVGSATHGLVKIEPKNENGVLIKEYPSHSKEYQLLIESFLKK